MLNPTLTSRSDRQLGQEVTSLRMLNILEGVSSARNSRIAVLIAELEERGSIVLDSVAAF